MSEFADYVADALTSHIAETPDLSDFIVRQGDDELVWVDVENQTFFLITVKEATAQVHP